eukprot:415306-Pyramimonas_sp.AAC.1
MYSAMREHGEQCGGVRASSQNTLSRYRRHTPAAMCFGHPRLYISLEKRLYQSQREAHGLYLSEQSREQHRLETLPHVQNNAN